MSRAVIRRNELFGATLRLGNTTVDLTDYATTGLRVVAVGPSGIGKTNSGLVIAEQLAAQGWIAVLIDPEGEIESLYGDAVASPKVLAERLAKRDQPIVVVSAKDAEAFLPYGEVILEAADEHRKPIFLMIDEGQMFSAPLKRADSMGEASDLVADFFQRGRKRSLDVLMTAHRFVGSLNRTAFANKNLTFVGQQQDPTAWSSLAAQFRGSHIDYPDLAALAPGQFFMFGRRGVEKVDMPMAEALAAVAPKATAAKPVLPSTFTQWDRAMAEIPTARLDELNEEVITLLTTVAGLSNRQYAAGMRALSDERAARE